MKRVELFVRRFIQNEIGNYELYRTEGAMDLYNQSLVELRSYLFDFSQTEYFSIRLGLGYMEKSHDEEFWEELPFYSKLKKRNLYKISEYELNSQFYYCSYLSCANTGGALIKTINQCFIAKAIGGSFKFISQYSFNKDNETWDLEGGEPLPFFVEENYKPTSIERYLPPINDKSSERGDLRER